MARRRGRRPGCAINPPSGGWFMATPIPGPDRPPQPIFTTAGTTRSPSFSAAFRTTAKSGGEFAPLSGSEWRRVAQVAQTAFQAHLPQRQEFAPLSNGRVAQSGASGATWEEV